MKYENITGGDKSGNSLERVKPNKQDDYPYIELSENKCLRCGKCCVVWYILDNIIYYKDCRYLIKIMSRTCCSIYQNRIGKSLGYGNICILRAQLNFNIPDCPYNRKGLPTHPVYDPKFKKVKL